MFEKGKVEAEASGKRYCKKCGKEIPSDNESNLCDACLKKRNDRIAAVTAVATPVVAFLGVNGKKIAHAAVEAAPKVIEAAKPVANTVSKVAKKLIK